MNVKSVILIVAAVLFAGGTAFVASRQSQYDEFRKKVPDVELQRFFDLG